MRGHARLLPEHLGMGAVRCRVVQLEHALEVLARAGQLAAEVARDAAHDMGFEQHSRVARLLQQPLDLVGQLARLRQAAAHHVVGPQAEQYRHDLRYVAGGLGQRARVAVGLLHTRVGVAWIAIWIGPSVISSASSCSPRTAPMGRLRTSSSARVRCAAASACAERASASSPAFRQ
jgi:hypothetical protein